jgi:hypothetical protein
MCGDLPSHPPVPNTVALKEAEWKNRKTIKSNCGKERKKERKKGKKEKEKREETQSKATRR